MLAAVLLSAAACSDDESAGPTRSAATVPPSGERRAIVLDYSPTVSDAGALLYLAAHPDVDLLAVTLPGTGEADCDSGVRTTRALLAAAGREGVPVGCGREEPMVGARDWPEEWRNAHEGWADLQPDVPDEALADAEQLLFTTLTGADEPVIVVTVGPMTNLGLVLTAHPELVDAIDRVVVMGGAVDVAGNVEASPTAEWNLYIDPESVRRVLTSGVPVVFVPLDATNDVPWNDRLTVRLGALDGPAARMMNSIVERTGLAGVYLRDELAVMTAIEPTLVTLEQRTISIDDEGATNDDPAGSDVQVAVAADADAAEDEWLRVLNGAPEGLAPLTPEELTYMVELGGVDSRLNAGLSDLYQDLESGTGANRDRAAQFVEGFTGGVATAVAELRTVVPPPSLVAAHEEFVAALQAFADLRPDLLAAVAGADGTEVFTILESALAKIGADAVMRRAEDACSALVTYSFLRNGPRPCSITSG